MIQLPQPPNRLDTREDFILKMDAFVQALPKCIQELQEYISSAETTINAKLNSIELTLKEIKDIKEDVQRFQKSTKDIQRVSSEGVLNEWTQQLYAKGATVLSPLDLRAYRALKSTSANVDPSLNTDWSLVNIFNSLSISKIYTEGILKLNTNNLILKEGIYTLSSASVGDEIKITALEITTLKDILYLGTKQDLVLQKSSTKSLQYSGEVYGWI